jgi:uncharacterized protein
MATNETKLYDKALPEISTLTQPFWTHCKTHELWMQYCEHCQEWIWYPKAWCPSCGRRDKITWKKLSGKGTVYSYTVIRQVIDNSQAFQADLPFLVALIELEEGPRIYSNIATKEVAIDDAVEVYFEDVSPDVSLPKFKKSS